MFYCLVIPLCQLRLQGRSTNDVLNELKLVPKFNERDPDIFFVLFEHLADAHEWSDSMHTLMLQCVLTRRAQQAFSSLGNRESTT